MRKSTSKDIKGFNVLQEAGHQNTRTLLPVSLAVLFMTIVGIFTYTVGEIDSIWMLTLAAVICGYMALNIGANDVANNVGPAVGSKSMSMMTAIIIAAVFESSGALLAGGDVVSTIKKGIITISPDVESQLFVTAMFSALLAAALWLNLATWLGAPVSTTHSIVGGVAGAGAVALGIDAINWDNMGSIAASWVISPMLGAFIAASFYALIRLLILNREDKITAAQKWIPVYIGIMVGAFTMYMMKKGLKKIIKFDTPDIIAIGLLFAVLSALLMRPVIRQMSTGLENRRRDIATLFQWPLVVSAAFLSFAHGANDVANAVGPLAGIVGVLEGGTASAKVGIPLWVMIIGALGISLGLLLFGPKLIRTVGEQITKLDRTRASCVALSAAITVLIASWMGLPVSSTHIAVGSIFGIGLFRESIEKKRRHMKTKTPEQIAKQERRKLVRRRSLLGIAAAWIITVPCAAGLSALIYVILTASGFPALVNA